MTWITWLSIGADVHDDVRGCTQMYSHQSSINYIVIFYTKRLRIKWSIITNFHDFCRKCFEGHSIMLVLWSFRSGTGLEHIFSSSPWGAQLFFLSEKTGKRCGAGGESEIYKETSHRPGTGKHVCIPQVRHSHRKFSSFLQNSISEYGSFPLCCSCTNFKTSFNPWGALSNLQTWTMINENVARSAGCEQ